MRFLLSLFLLLIPLTTFSLSEVNLRNTDSVQVTGGPRDSLAAFIGPIAEFFYSPSGDANSVENTFFNIAYGVKNFVVTIAVIFLLIGILKVLFA
jgi:hypothetical protein